MGKSGLLGKIRQLQMILSVLVFVLITILSWKITGFDITEIQVSEWGAAKDTWWLWNGGIMLVAAAILFNVIYWIYRHPRLRYKKVFYILFTFMSACLFVVGLFPTGEYQLLHNIPAFTYFFAYPLLIFTMGFTNRSNIHYKEWLKHLVLSVTMITIPMIFIKAFDGMAISEILHTSVVAIWNITLLKKHETTKQKRI